MENHRLLLYFTLFFLCYLIWAQWQVDYGPKPEAPAVSESTQTKDIDIEVDVPLETASDIEPVQAPATQKTVSKKIKQHDRQRIHVITDVYDMEIDTQGGDIRKLVLRKYAVKADKPEEKLNLLTDSESAFHVAQSGLVSADQNRAPTHKAVYRAEQTSYRLAEGVDELVIPLHWQGEDGTSVTKTFTLRRDDYTVDVEHAINAGNKDWSGSQYMQLVRTPPEKGSESSFIYTYTGGVVFNEEIKYEKIDFDDMADDNLKLELQDGWMAMIQHYFLAAWIPEHASKNLYYSRHNNNLEHYILGVRTPAKRIIAGERASFNSRLVAGPKLQHRLEQIEPSLELTVDYGVLTIIAKPLFWLLDIFHGWFGNWGWAIIFLTISVKALFYKLSEMSYRSMAKMRKVAPRMKAMKERFGDDRQAMSKAMMDLYKREKINPMGGCLPILAQMPVFIALYWVLLESVEMRHAPFILWIDNLSDKDPFFILPVLMGLSMYIQQKLNPAPIDPVQQKVFQIMPFAFTIMFAFFPSGLVLYWVVNNVLSIIQQYIITKRIEAS